MTGWLLVQDLPGIRPTRQRRSQETTVALLETGAAMLRDCAFDALSIDELCGRLGVTIGAFYGRFESKDAFFAAQMSLVTRRCLAAIDAALADDDRTEADLAAICRDIVAVVTTAIRDNAGVLRAAMQYKTVQPARWVTVSETGSAIVARAMPLLLARMGRGRRAAKERTIAFAFQMVFGTLINAIQNKPRTVGIETEEMVDRLALAMFLQLDHEARSSATGARKTGR